MRWRKCYVKGGYLAEGLKIDQAFEYGTVLAIESLWEKIGLKKTFSDAAKANKLDGLYERALFAMTANRLGGPEFKLGVWDRWHDAEYLTSHHCLAWQIALIHGAMNKSAPALMKAAECLAARL